MSCGDAPTIQRDSLCLAGQTPGLAIHAGEEEFRRGLDKYYLQPESNMTERLVALKAELRTLDNEAFWNRLMEGMTEICGAQFAFVSKRILVDDHNTAVEMPPIGQPGSCLMGVALYWNDGMQKKAFNRDYKYYAWDAPCAYMKHDKVFLCPEGLSSFITDNPNQLPFECDAYLGVPLFADGKCFAHFGMMWNRDGLARKKHLSWALVEMFMHSLEDQVMDRLVAGKGFAKINSLTKDRQGAAQAHQVISEERVTPSQSLKPYARSLSHELRTPMQGVVGMLDVMHATVQEQIKDAVDGQFRSIFQTLRDNIETVQDSSKRAVEAADNVVHAYDLDMQVPDTPLQELNTTSAPNAELNYFGSRPTISQSKIVNPLKRKISSPVPWSSGAPTKVRQAETIAEEVCSPMDDAGIDRHAWPLLSDMPKTPKLELPQLMAAAPGVLSSFETESASTLTSRQSNLRELLPIVLTDALRVGGRPDSTTSEPIPLGEKMDVRTRGSNGHVSQKMIEWSVDTDVPEDVAIDERDLTKLLSAVLLNAIKFTDVGEIKLHARLHENRRYVLISVSDTGSGIPANFQSELFKPFAQVDASITRSREGLGLGLLVAKGVARRTGGDIKLVRSSTATSGHGTEFEIRIPIDHTDRSSRPATPHPSTPDLNLYPLSPATEDASEISSPTTEVSPTVRLASSNFLINNMASNAVHVESRPSMSRRISSTPRVPYNGHPTFDNKLGEKFPLKFMVAEDNRINRRLLVSMLGKLGYKNIYEAFDGREAVRVMHNLLSDDEKAQRKVTPAQRAPVVDVVLMDLWMPEMDGYEATEKILEMYRTGRHGLAPVVLAVSADVTEASVHRATKTGMQGYMTKPYKLMDLQRLIMEFGAVRSI